MTKFAAFAVVLMLAGCAVHTPDGSVIVDPNSRYGHGHGHGKGKGNFCPPGQAKKGNC